MLLVSATGAGGLVEAVVVVTDVVGTPRAIVRFIGTEAATGSSDLDRDLLERFA